MDSPYSPLEFSLLNDWQRDFPLTSRPFAAIGAKVSVGETAVLDTLGRLHKRGAISRVGAVFAPRRIGAGTLAAVAAPPERLEQVAALISARSEVNHNYQREHHWNIWFVATARDATALAATLAEIRVDTGCPVLSMPLKREFHIDLGFDLGRGHVGRPESSAPACGARALTSEETALMAALEDGLSLTPQPYAELARRAGIDEATALGHLHHWLAEGLIKRFGIIVRHHELGYRANAMVVFDLPDAEVAATGARLAAEPAVTLCYQRERNQPHWPYNLYCMVHGRSREDVAPVVARLAASAGREPAVLFSVRRFKQCGARYFSGAPAR